MATHQQFQHWGFKDLVRFEAHRMLDHQIDSLELEARDRKIFNDSGDCGKDRRSFFRFWLNNRQDVDRLEPDIGALVESLFRLMGWIVSIAGILAGIGSSLAALQYDGEVPVNVAIFLGFLLFPQILLLLSHVIVLVWAAFRQDILGRIYVIPKIFLRVLGQYFWKLYTKFRKSDEQASDHMFHLGKLFSQFAAQHGKLIGIRAYALTQQFAVFFNVGIVASALLLLAFSDRAFGWQSSLTDSPEVVSNVVEVIAFPWTWMLPEGVGYPNVEALQGSYIVLGKSIEGLDQNHLTSWWPFLVAGIVFYGLLPRVFGWLIAVFWFNRSLKRMDFCSAVYNPLWARAHSFDLESKGEYTTAREETETVDSDVEERVVSKSYRVFIQEEIEERYGMEVLDSWIKSHCGISVYEVKSFVTDQTVDFPEEGVTPLLLVEGWQPPIEEKLDFLRQLVESQTPGIRDWYVVLLGKPARDAVRELAPEMQNVWKTKIAGMGLIHLHLLHTEKRKEDYVD